MFFFKEQVYIMYICVCVYIYIYIYIYIKQKYIIAYAVKDYRKPGL